MELSWVICLLRAPNKEMIKICTKGEKDNDEKNHFNAFHIFLGLASIPVIFTLIGCFYMAWTHWGLLKKRCCPQRRNSMKEDKNDTYGTYARGWDGEGEYGD